MRGEIETTDIFRSAYLLCNGSNLSETRIGNDRQVYFLIAGDTVQDDDFQYRTGQGSVNPLQLRETLNMLRDIVFAKTKNENRNGRRHHGNSASRY